MTELMTKDDVETSLRLLKKLCGARAALTDEVGAHCRWELEHREPARLLLLHDLAPGSAEQSLQSCVNQLIRHLSDPRGRDRARMYRFLCRED